MLFVVECRKSGIIRQKSKILERHVGETPVLSGALVVRQGLFSDGELDAIVKLGESLALEKAELSVGGQGYDNIRRTQVAWVERNAETEMLYRRVEEAVLALNARYFR